MVEVEIVAHQQQHQQPYAALRHVLHVQGLGQAVRGALGPPEVQEGEAGHAEHAEEGGQHRTLALGHAPQGHRDAGSAGTVVTLLVLSRC